MLTRNVNITFFRVSVSYLYFSRNLYFPESRGIRSVRTFDMYTIICENLYYSIQWDVKGSNYYLHEIKYEELSKL